jgi:hypothetical protein
MHPIPFSKFITSPPWDQIQIDCDSTIAQRDFVRLNPDIHSFGCDFLDFFVYAELQKCRAGGFNGVIQFVSDSDKLPNLIGMRLDLRLCRSPGRDCRKERDSRFRHCVDLRPQSSRR